MKKLIKQAIFRGRQTLRWYFTPAGVLSAVAIIGALVLAVVGQAGAATIVLACWLAALLPYKLQRERADRVGQSVRLSKRVATLRSDVLKTPTVAELVEWQDELDRQVAVLRAKMASVDQVRESMRLHREAAQAGNDQISSLEHRLEDETTAMRSDMDELGAILDAERASLRSEVEAITERLDREIPVRLRRIEQQSASDVAALVALYTLLDVDQSLPSFASWALSPGAALAVAESILGSGADLVVEAGSGSSTVVAALALAKQGHGRVVALEHDSAFAEKTRRELRRLGVENYANVVLAPLEEQVVHGEPYSWYAVDALDLDGQIDVLLVDGPPSATGPRARYPAVPLLAPLLADNATIFLDDVDRQDEQEIARLWNDHFGVVLSMGLADGELARGQFRRSNTTIRSVS